MKISWFRTTPTRPREDPEPDPFLVLHRDVLGFREQVIAQWPTVSTIEDRAELALLREIPVRPR